MGISHRKQTIISHIVEEKKQKQTKYLTLKAILALMKKLKLEKLLRKCTNCKIFQNSTNSVTT